MVGPRPPSGPQYSSHPRDPRMGHPPHHPIHSTRSFGLPHHRGNHSRGPRVYDQYQDYRPSPQRHPQLLPPAPGAAHPVQRSTHSSPSPSSSSSTSRRHQRSPSPVVWTAENVVEEGTRVTRRNLVHCWLRCNPREKSSVREIYDWITDLIQSKNLTLVTKAGRVIDSVSVSSIREILKSLVGKGLKRLKMDVIRYFAANPEAIEREKRPIRGPSPPTLLPDNVERISLQNLARLYFTEIIRDNELKQRQGSTVREIGDALQTYVNDHLHLYPYRERDSWSSFGVYLPSLEGALYGLARDRLLDLEVQKIF